MTPDLMMTDEQKNMIASLARMYGGMMNSGYQSPPMYSAGPDPNQIDAINRVRAKMGLPAYQQPGFNTAPSQNVDMTLYSKLNPTDAQRVVPSGGGPGGNNTNRATVTNPTRNQLKGPSKQYYW